MFVIQPTPYIYIYTAFVLLFLLFCSCVCDLIWIFLISGRILIVSEWVGFIIIFDLVFIIIIIIFDFVFRTGDIY